MWAVQRNPERTHRTRAWFLLFYFLLNYWLRLKGTVSFIHATVLPGFDSRPELAISFSWSKGISSALVAREKALDKGRSGLLLKSIRACYCGTDAPYNSNTVSFRSGTMCARLTHWKTNISQGRFVPAVCHDSSRARMSWTLLGLQNWEKNLFKLVYSALAQKKLTR